MKDTYDLRLQDGQLSKDITFHYSGKVIVHRDGSESYDSINLIYIEALIYHNDVFVEAYTYSDIDVMGLTKAQTKLVEAAEEQAFNKYITNSDNKITYAEHYADHVYIDTEGEINER